MTSHVMPSLAATPGGSAVVPSREDLVDAGALLALSVVATIEFRSTFGGWAYLIVAILGVVLGIVITHFANVLRQPIIVLVAMGLAVFFLLGGAVALQSTPGASPLPTGSTLSNLANTSVYGWKDLLTTLPRVSGAGALLVIPYILGLFSGLGGFALARRTRSSFAPVVAPLAAFVLVILLGSADPSNASLLACVFAVGALVWGTIRSQRIRPVAQSGSGAATRVATAGSLLLVAALGSYAVGSGVPGSGRDRVVLRKYVQPPTTIGNFPSPLAEFRLYVGQQKVQNKLVSLADQTLFTVSGSLPAGSPIRFATLDNYNGIVWASTTGGQTVGAKPNTFLRVGSSVDDAALGPNYSMSVAIDRYDDYWMPTSGAVQGIKFTDRAAAQQSADFRYNLATGTGVLPSKIAGATSYTLKVAGVAEPPLTASDDLASDGFSQDSAFLKDATATLAGTSGTTTAKVLAMAATLKATGKFTHGDPGSSFAYYLPGHSQGRLIDFVKGVLPGVLYVGDDEQYASAYALMIEQLGVPARVIVGVESLPKGGVVKGADVDAWVEVQRSDGAWRDIPTEMFLDRNNTPDKKQLQQQQQQEAGTIVPPPPQGRPKTTISDAAQSVGDSTSQKRGHKSTGASFHLPAWVTAIVDFAGPPVGILLLIAGAIVGIKLLRRNRRRTRGAPATRLALGWKEITDHARDLGVPVTARTTRREQGRELSSLGVSDLAFLADAHVFGAGDLTEAVAASFWNEVAKTRKRMSSTVGRWRRLRAAVNLATFLPPRSASPTR